MFVDLAQRQRIVLTKQVALRMNTNLPHGVGVDSQSNLRDVAEIHSDAWTHLPYVVEPLGYLDAEDSSGTPSLIILANNM